MKILHNSALAVYRSPLGALKTNESALLRVRCDGVSGVRIRIFINDVGTDYDMIYADSFWCYRFTPPASPCVVWYYFIVDSDEGVRYYGPPSGKSQGLGVIYEQPCPSFQLTVYDKDFDTPAWFRGSTMYQIFPDRFRRGDPGNFARGAAYHRSMGRKCVLHQDWNEQPLYQPLEGEPYYSPCDFYGGDLQGIIDSLDYLKQLGVDVLYLNPIVEAASNHRYDTGDYMRVDPFLGTNGDFERLCHQAALRGIHLLLDGVYSHTGSDSRYFNKGGNYPDIGAFQSEKSPYYKWYTFFTDKNNYKCWWGFDTLPEVNETDESWQDYVITGKNSVFRHWTSLGASGFRLDVADELPDEVIELMRTALKAENRENVLLGEVWEDATTKRSYGANRRYALGKGLDSVMNYPFKEAVIAFLLSQIGAPELENFLTSQRLNYPAPMYHALMNLVSSHDVPRLRTILATGQNAEGMSREEQAALCVGEEQDRTAARLQRLAGVLQFTVPGVPSIYYGDEYGMHGFKDPFNRGPFERRDPETCAFFRQIGAIRRRETALRRGYVSFLALGEDAIAILRFCLGGRDSFGQPAADRILLAIVNRGIDAVETEIDLNDFAAGLPADALNLLAQARVRKAVDAENGLRIPVRSKRFPITVESQDYVLLYIE